MEHKCNTDCSFFNKWSKNGKCMKCYPGVPTPAHCSMESKNVPV